MRILSMLLLASLMGVLAIVSGAAAKGPFSAEISGGDLASPVTIEGPLATELVFANDAVAAAPPDRLEPAYTVKLFEQPDGETGEQGVILTLTYFPGDGDAPALLRGEWDDGDRYFQASREFQALLDGAIDGARPDHGGDGVGAVWYITPSLALGLLLIGGLAGRRLFLRRDD